MNNISFKALVVMALFFMLITGIQGIKAHRVMMVKTQSQVEVTENILRWRQNYKALEESVKKWEKNYRRQESVPDLMSLFSIVNLGEYGLSANTDAMILNKVEPVVQNGMPIGLTKICLASSGSGDASALEVQATNYQALFTGIMQLAQRLDISIGTITIKSDKVIPMANLGDFCVLLSK